MIADAVKAVIELAHRRFQNAQIVLIHQGALVDVDIGGCQENTYQTGLVVNRNTNQRKNRSVMEYLKQIHIFEEGLFGTVYDKFAFNYMEKFHDGR